MSLEPKKRKNSQKKKMSIGDMSFAVTKENDKILKMLEKQEKKKDKKWFL